MKMRYFWPILLALLSGCTLDTAIYPELIVDLNSNDGNLSTREDDEQYERINKISVRLSKQPSADVTVHTSVDISGEVAILEEELVFTPENYHEPQTITYVGVADDIVDGDRQVLLTLTASSSDPSFNGRKFDCTILNVDVDMPRIILKYSSLETSEDGTSVEIGASLSSKPLAPVTVPVMVSDPLEASVSPKELRFDPNNWNTQQTVTVTGLPDNTVDRDKKYNLEFGKLKTNDENYMNVQPDPIELINKDVDHADIVVRNEDVLVTKEAGNVRVKFYVNLTSIPSSEVSIDLKVSDDTEAEVSPTQLVFTSENWNKEQVITVWGRDDEETDGDQLFYLIFSSAVSEDMNYNNKLLDPIPMKNVDDDSMGVEVSSVSTELACDGSDGVFEVKLSKKPISTVKVELSFVDKERKEISLTIEPSTLNFSPDDWDKPQSVTVHAPKNGDYFEKAYYKYVYLDAAFINVAEDQLINPFPTALFSLKAFCDPGDFHYTGDVQKVRLPAGYYQMEVVGAGGGAGKIKKTGGRGGKASAEFKLKAVADVFVYVGGAGQACTLSGKCGGYNGGASGVSGSGYGGGGGGASDIRIASDAYDKRVIVAGGGGGGSSSVFLSHSAGGAGGWDKGGKGKKGTSDHAATLGGGVDGCSDGSDKCKFGEASPTTTVPYTGGGGGGWFSGLSGQNMNVSGAGGSGYIHGYQHSTRDTLFNDDVIDYVGGANWGTGAESDTNGSARITVVTKEIE